MSTPIYDDLCYRLHFYPHDPLWRAMSRQKWTEYYERTRPDYRLQYIPKGR